MKIKASQYLTILIHFVNAIFTGTVFFLILLALPETLDKKKKSVGEAAEGQAQNSPPGDSPHSEIRRTSTREAVHRCSVKCIKILRIFFVDPLAMILYLRFPAVFLTVYYASITFGSLYVLNISIQATFEKPPYSFPTLIVGFLYLPASLGYVIASIGGGRWMDRIMAREARKAGRLDENGLPVYRPEDRMRENAWLGAIFYPIALVVYGWSVQKGVHWIVPVRGTRYEAAATADSVLRQMIATFFFGLGSMILFSLATTMLTEFMPRKSSTGVAVSLEYSWQKPPM
jgi:MFS family permease